ncbi:hypothetical protein P8452_44506 [Trifolium repens]|nr:hypothetical protein P8452_44506 [Trifolium repens]
MGCLGPILFKVVIKGKGEMKMFMLILLAFILSCVGVSARTGPLLRPKVGVNIQLNLTVKISLTLGVAAIIVSFTGCIICNCKCRNFKSVEVEESGDQEVGTE